jgi:hypothetical protein
MYRRFANNAFGELRSTIDAFSTTLFVDGVYADKFPIPTAGDLVLITVQGLGDNLEIMRLVARDGDQFTVVRGQEGTLAQGFVAGAIVELRLTADALNQAAYKDQDEQVFGTWTFEESPQVPLNPTQPNDAVPLGYLNQQLALQGVAYGALTYRASADQTDFGLTTPDVYGNTLDISALTSNPSAIAVHCNGSLLMYDPGDASVPGADYTVDLANNLVQLNIPASVDDRVQIELTVREVEVAATFETVKLTDFDLDWSDPNRVTGQLPTLGGQIDGARTVFPLHADDAADDYPLADVANTPNVLVWINGSTLEPGVDYTISGSTITFASPLRVGSTVWAVWHKPVQLAA